MVPLFDADASALVSEPVIFARSNINKEDNPSGDDLLGYLQPFPMNGTGWHRCVYVLYEHAERIDFSAYLKGISAGQTFAVDKLSFRTLDFYQSFEKSMKPVSLSFFQTEWDLSVRRVFHDVLSNYSFLEVFIKHSVSSSYLVENKT